MSERIEITIPLPPPAVSPNARCHWATKAKAVKQQRQDAAWAAQVAKANLSCAAGYPVWERATIHATFYRPKGRVAMDQDNAIASLKASIDGLADAGIFANDRNVTWLAPTQVIGKRAGNLARVVLVIEPLTAAEPQAS